MALSFGTNALRVMGTSTLRSMFLIDLRRQFEVGPKGRPAKHALEFAEEVSESPLRESLEVLRDLRARNQYVYQSLTVWGDQVATFTVRESLRKRRHKILLQIPEFPVVAPLERVVETFWWAHDRLLKLGTPPGFSSGDRVLLNDIEQRWLALSFMEAQ